MAEYERNTAAGLHTSTAAIDEGLRTFMLSVYNYMAGGLAITGVVSYLVYTMAVTTEPSSASLMLRDGLYTTPFGNLIYQTPLRFVIMFAPLVMVFFLSARIHKMSVGTAQTTFWAFAAIMGASLSSIFIVFTQGSITQVFFITAAAFGSLSLWGYTTKKDISGWGSFLFMGLIGIIIAMIVNMFLGSSALHFAISVIGVLVFAGLTAYDTQAIKNEYYAGDGEAVMGRKSIMGALRLYLDFLNMFLFLLSLFGRSE